MLNVLRTVSDGQVVELAKTDGGRLDGGLSSLPAAMSADPPLTDDERRVLEVLMHPNRGVQDRTVEKIAEAVGMMWTPTHEALRSLETRRPQLAHPDVDARLNIQFWRTTYDAADAMEEG